DRLVGIREPAVRVEARDGAFGAVLAQDPHAVAGAPERARRIAVGALDGDADLARAVAVDDLAAEAAREGAQVLARPLVSAGETERAVRVVGALGRVHDVRERAPDVVEERRAVTAYVAQEARLREATREREPAGHGEREPERQDLRVRVEERHGAVDDVVARG